MKATFLHFDVQQCATGPATGAIRRIVEAWEAIDWFEPLRRDSDLERAEALLREHHRLAQSCEGSSLGTPCEVRPSIGDGSAFSALCERVRTPGNGWDWKYGSLKTLAHRHKQARGWDRNEHAVLVPWGGGEPSPLTGHVYLKFEGHPNLVVSSLYSKLDPREALPPDLATAAEWYFSYAQSDFVECVEWQLAQKDSRLEGNPFFPLVQCYGAGGYPFSLSPTQYVLHAFARDA
ncbi:hypothetical protein [Polyangium sp. 6x1]|uniref:hypothetical protein n=1 Tax=Polyangium sp. 6x1 TaxID=3042689 RepID=UPI0024825036|nr:hypothetical protein [Polyangium sp. 6x1]MDI1451183.1 hypothetical protein [Polyangium sp. 6x1]